MPALRGAIAAMRYAAYDIEFCRYAIAADFAPRRVAMLASPPPR